MYHSDITHRECVVGFYADRPTTLKGGKAISHEEDLSDQIHQLWVCDYACEF